MGIAQKNYGENKNSLEVDCFKLGQHQMATSLLGLEQEYIRQKIEELGGEENYKQTLITAKLTKNIFLN